MGVLNEKRCKCSSFFIVYTTIFIAINYSNENMIYNNLQFVDLNVNTEIPPSESKYQFTKICMNSSLILNLINCKIGECID